MKRIAIILAALLFATAARSDGIPGFSISSDGTTGGISAKLGPATPPVTGALLLEDNASFLLLEDGSSDLCLEGGC